MHFVVQILRYTLRTSGHGHCSHLQVYGIQIRISLSIFIIVGDRRAVRDYLINYDRNDTIDFFLKQQVRYGNALVVSKQKRYIL
jgi:hypothetical protein